MKEAFSHSLHAGRGVTPKNRFVEDSYLGGFEGSVGLKRL
jgi:hypothetical protein